MRIQDIIYFAPGIRIDEINFADREQMISAFADRINQYYLQPAQILLDTHQEFHAFSVGVLTITAMDAISFYSISPNDGTERNNRITLMLLDINDFGILHHDRDDVALNFNSKFRNGLIHEGRIKAGHQFSFQYGGLFQEEGGFYIVNPNTLYNKVKDYFDRYLELLRSDVPAYSQFIRRIRQQFEPEIRNLRRLRRRQP